MDAGQTHLPREDVPEDPYEFRLPAESSLERWLFFDASRWTVTAVVLAAVLVVVAGLVATGTLSVENENTAALLMSVFVGGNFTLISIVITINQLVLSREFGKPHTLRERNEGIVQFRRDAESLTGMSVGPADPLRFVRAVLASLDDRASSIRAAVESDGEAAEHVRAYATAVDEQTDGVEDAFADAEFGDFRVLRAMLFYRSAWQLHALDRLRTEFGDDLPDDVVEELREQAELLRTFNVARQYVQTLYMQKELAQLSRLLLYVGVPTLLFTGLTMLVYVPGGGSTVGPDWLAVVYTAAATVGFAPISLLLAYVVRVSTIVSRMPLLSPFITDG